MILHKKKLNSFIRQTALLALLTLITNTSSAGIYKWVDEEGNVHYGERRPTNASSEKMDVQKYSPKDLSTYQRPGSNEEDSEKNAEGEQAEDTEKNADEPEKKPESAADKKRRLAACAQAQSNVTRMKSIGRVRSRDKDGNVTYMSQKDKEAKMKQASSLMTKHCK